jgi:hypothetical protein
MILFHIYKKTHGNALPSSLDDLKPLCKGTFPRDMYSGKPFVYEPAKRTFWSVGKSSEVVENTPPGAITVPVVWTVS